MKSFTKPWPTTQLLGITVDCPRREDLLNRILEHVKDRGQTTHLVTMNAEMAYSATQDSEFHKILAQADMIIPDGIGVVWALGHQGVPVSRLPGVELVEELFKQAPSQGLRLAILGSSPETLKAFQDQLPERFGQVNLVFARNGYFKPEEEEQIIAELNHARPDVLFVALGVPKQENWIARWRNQLEIPLLMGVGGSFDVLSGRLDRAPVCMQRSHLEWLFRLYQQPTRWRRMLALPRFVMTVLRT